MDDRKGILSRQDLQNGGGDETESCASGELLQLLDECTNRDDACYEFCFFMSEFPFRSLLEPILKEKQTNSTGLMAKDLQQRYVLRGFYLCTRHNTAMVIIPILKIALKFSLLLHVCKLFVICPEVIVLQSVLYFSPTLLRVILSHWKKQIKQIDFSLYLKEV